MQAPIAVRAPRRSNFNFDFNLNFNFNCSRGRTRMNADKINSSRGFRGRHGQEQQLDWHLGAEISAPSPLQAQLPLPLSFAVSSCPSSLHVLPVQASGKPDTERDPEILYLRV
jgi:hypothetical protein